MSLGGPKLPQLRATGLGHGWYGEMIAKGKRAEKAGIGSGRLIPWVESCLQHLLAGRLGHAASLRPTSVSQSVKGDNAGTYAQ